MLIEINDITAPELDVFARLTEAQLRSRLEPEKGVFIAESPKVITTAVENGYQPLSFLMERRHAAGDAAALLARFPDVPAYTAEREALAHLTGYTLTRGVLCAMRRPQLPDAEAVCAGARRVAVLEGVADSTNVGALFRSAAALGVEAVLLTESCTDPLYRRCIRVSMGNVFFVPWAYLPDDQWQALLHENGFESVAMALREDAKVLWDPALREIKKIAVVMGSEGPGLKASTIAACDHTVTVPMTNGVDSLNVAAASAVAFYQLALLRQHPL